MLWLYWSGMVLLFGGEINAEIEKAEAESKGASSDVQRTKHAA
jgi:membrane protein